MSLVAAWGCMIKDGILATQGSIRIEPATVMTERDLTMHWRGRLGVVPFTGPSYVGTARATITKIYFEKLLERGPFQQTRMLHLEAGSDEEALRIGADGQCDAVLTGAIDYLLDSIGSSPTAIELSVRILDVRTGHILAFYRQRGQSRPGADVDLVWNILPGNPSVRVHALADLLADQAAQHLNALVWQPSGR